LFTYIETAMDPTKGKDIKPKGLGVINKDLHMF